MSPFEILLVLGCLAVIAVGFGLPKSAKLRRWGWLGIALLLAILASTAARFMGKKKPARSILERTDGTKSLIEGIAATAMVKSAEADAELQAELIEEAGKLAAFETEIAKAKTITDSWARRRALVAVMERHK